jgi:hypothetical protein
LKLEWKERNDFCLARNSNIDKYRKEIKTKELKEEEVYEIFCGKQ